MNMKKALKHDVEVAGKTIPTMILVGLFLVGGGSAALLSSFGTVSGEADVQQAVEVDEPTSVSYNTVDEETLVAGQTTADSFTVDSNNQQSAVPYQVDLEREATDGENTGNMKGVTTHVFEVVDSKTVYEGSEGSTLAKGYDISEDEVTFTVDFADSSSEDGQLHVDTDNDGRNEFHLGLYGYDSPTGSNEVTRNENGVVTSWVINENEDGYNQGSVSGVSAGIDQNSVITVSIDAEKLGSDFRYGFGVNSGESYTSGETGGSVGPSSVDSSEWGTASPGDQVAASLGTTSQLDDGGEITTGYNAEENRATFNVDEGALSGADGGAVYFDTDQDGQYDFQVSYLRHGGPNDISYWEYRPDFCSNNPEDCTAGWHQANEWDASDDSENHEVDATTDYGFTANLKSNGFALEVNKDELGDNFGYRAKVNHDGNSPSEYEAEVGASQTLEVASGSEDDYVMVNDFAFGLNPDYSYGVDASVESVQ